MNIIWTSYQGINTKHNSDYGIFCHYPKHYICIIGDAREAQDSDIFIEYFYAISLESYANKHPYMKY